MTGLASDRRLPLGLFPGNPTPTEPDAGSISFPLPTRPGTALELAQSKEIAKWPMQQKSW